MDADSELFAIFRAEVEEQIEDLCGLLERTPKRWRVGRLFQISHNVKGAARLVGVDPVREAAHALEDLFVALRDGAELSPPVVALARAGADLLSACFETLDGGEPPDVGAYRKQVNGWLGELAPVTETLADEGSPASPAETQAAAEEEGSDGEVAAKGRSTAPETLRVAADKIDALMDVSSELVSLVFQLEGHRAAARDLLNGLSAAARRNRRLTGDPAIRQAMAAARSLNREVRDHTSDALRLSDELQASVRALRMVRIDGLRTLAGQTVRSACRETGKAARLTLSGGDTEVDRMVLEQLRDPLVHLLRNAVAHGIEPEPERVAAGKEAAGLVELTAMSAGEWVVVTVRDDGRGIEADRVRKHAAAAGIASAEELAATDDEAALDFLFRPGFSTSEAVTEVAGRGVGLDVVRSRLRAIGGTATIRSRPGHGSEVLLRMPLTRLTTTGVLVRAGDQVVAIPTAWVERTVQVARDQLTTADGAEAITLDGGLARLSSLAAVLGTTLTEAEWKPAVILSDGTRRRAILTDAIIGQREYIVQPLSWNLRGAPAVSGCTVLDGTTVVLVMDPPALLGSGATTDSWTGGPAAGRSRVLVVDDSATSRTLERNILRTAGYEVVAAVTGEAALGILASQEVDLVVSDVEMPGINGFELTRMIRGDARFERLPVILVTTLGSDADKQEGAEAGADAYIVKGAFDQDELLATVARLL